MSPKSHQNIAASVRQRLLNKARADKRPFNELLQYYAMERFLYRLSRSVHAKTFILKGALMFRVWHSPEFRPTMDIDVLGRTNNDQAHIVGLVKEILSVKVDLDGLLFDATTIQAERITEGADYEGIRIRFRCALGSAKISMQLDVGFGDVIFPGPEKSNLPTILDSPPPEILGYSRESAIAEKFEAMLKLRELNSRMKDFYDIWLLSRLFDFAGETLTEAISQTLKTRGTELSDEIVAFSDDFIHAKRIQWTAFSNRLNDDRIPTEFGEIVSTVTRFLSPIADALHSGSPTPIQWNAPGPWT